MPAQRIGKFLRFDDLGFTPSLGIETAQLNECVHEIQREMIKGVFGFPGFGFCQTNLDFLTRISHVTQVWFWEVSLDCVDGLYALKDLELFNIHDRKPGIDFAKFPKLKRLTWHYHTCDSNIGLLQNLRDFEVWRFNPKNRTFADLVVGPAIERLEINWANPTSIDELPFMPALKEIQFHYCRNLASLEGLERKAPKLERVVVTCCNRCTDISVLTKMPSLRSAFVNRTGITAALGIDEKRGQSVVAHL